MITRDDPLWFKDAVFYQIHVKSFCDSNNDGIGDFKGLTSRLDYLKDLGVTALWIMPFYPSPLRDDGYDIADYHGVNPDYGTLEDFREFVEAAHARDLRVVTELVINHTSDQHPWFQRARIAPHGSPERDFYVWSDTDAKWPETRIIFVDFEKSNWTWDPVAGRYYWHRFYSHQPDLNFDNPLVMSEVLEVMYYWLDMGVDGLRLDAIPYLVERDGTTNENNPETHDVVKRIRAAMDQRYPDRALLAEANMWPEDTQVYFGNGDECHMAFHFPLMPRLYMALARQDRHPIIDILSQTAPIPENCQWAIFLRNHDELTLEMVTPAERTFMWDYYAANPRARINLGIRRRLAPLMQNDRRRIELLFSLLMSMPGTPVIYYGDEIGMGDNILLEDRHGVRTAMQWSPDRNGGFSRCDPAQLFLPAINDPVYGFDAVNVEAQDRDPSSRLSWVRRLIAERKRHRALGRGVLGFILPENQQVLVYTRQLWEEGEVILCVCNVSEQMQVVDVDLRDFAGRVPVELFGRAVLPAVSEAPYRFTLPPFGFYWLRLCRPPEVRGWAVGPAALAPPFETIVLREGWDGLAGPAGDYAILLRSIHHYMRMAPDEMLERRLVLPLEVEGEPALAVLADLVAHGRVLEHLYIPLTLSWEDAVGTVGWWRLPQMLCRVRRVNRIGGLMDGGVTEPGNEPPLAALYETELDAGDGRSLRIEPDAATLTDARGETVRYMRIRR